MLNQFEEQIQQADGQITGITAADLMNKVFPEPRWAIPGLLPEGLNLLAGKPKKGKSIFALNIGLAISQGGIALGKIPVDQGAVLYLALEDTERRLQGRIKQMLSYCDRAPDDLHLFTKWPKMGGGGLELLETKIAEIPNLRLVIIDTLQRFRKPAQGNSQLYAEDYETITQIKELADRFCVCILLIHHLRKSGADDIFDTVTGSLGLTGCADGTLILESARGKTILHVEGRDIENTELALELDGRTLTWNLLGEASEVKATTDQQRLYDAIKESPEPVSPKELADLTSLKLGHLKNILAKFIERGDIRRTGYGRYIVNKQIEL